MLTSAKLGAFKTSTGQKRHGVLSAQKGHGACNPSIIYVIATGWRTQYPLALLTRLTLETCKYIPNKYETRRHLIKGSIRYKRNLQAKCAASIFKITQKKS